MFWWKNANFFVFLHPFNVVGFYHHIWCQKIKKLKLRNEKKKFDDIAMLFWRVYEYYRDRKRETDGTKLTQRILLTAQQHAVKLTERKSALSVMPNATVTYAEIKSRRATTSKVTTVSRNCCTASVSINIACVIHEANCKERNSCEVKLLLMLLLDSLFKL